MGSRKNAVGLPNFGEVTPNLYRGGQPGIDGLKTLQKLDITIVVDMRSGPNSNEKRAVEKLGMEYVSIPWHCPFPRDEVFARFLQLIRENPGKKIFVHCRLGDDRVGMMTAAYRMAEQGWSANQAMEEMKTSGFTRLHHLICPGLAAYEKHFPERFKNSPAFAKLRAEQAGMEKAK